MIDVRQPFDLRQNEDLLFSADDPWWLSNRVLTTSGAVMLSLVLLWGYGSLVLTIVRLTQAWVGQ